MPFSSLPISANPLFGRHWDLRLSSSQSVVYPINESGDVRAYIAMQDHGAKPHDTGTSQRPPKAAHGCASKSSSPLPLNTLGSRCFRLQTTPDGRRDRDERRGFGTG